MSNNLIKGIEEQVLAAFNDAGPDTIRRYVSQVEYAALWCVRMIKPGSDIQGVIPEGIDDVTVMRDGVCELYQVKTRTESAGAWRFSDVLPVILKQYAKRKAYKGHTTFHFVSNRMAETTSQARDYGHISLYRFKSLLELVVEGQTLREEEKADWRSVSEKLTERIREDLIAKESPELCGPEDTVVAQDLLLRTRIETDSQYLRPPDNLQRVFANHVQELEAVLAELEPDGPELTNNQICRYFERIVALVLRKILMGANRSERTIRPEEVLALRTAFGGNGGYPDLDEVPGTTILEKKVRLGNLDLGSLTSYRREKLHAESIARELKLLQQQDKVSKLSDSLLSHHSACRDSVYGEPSDIYGRKVLELVRRNLEDIVGKHLPDYPGADSRLGLGLLWLETEACNAWWNVIEDQPKKGSP